MLKGRFQSSLKGTRRWQAAENRSSPQKYGHTWLHMASSTSELLKSSRLSNRKHLCTLLQSPYFSLIFHMGKIDNSHVICCSKVSFKRPGLSCCKVLEWALDLCTAVIQASKDLVMFIKNRSTISSLELNNKIPHFSGLRFHQEYFCSNWFYFSGFRHVSICSQAIFALAHGRG